MTRVAITLFALALTGCASRYVPDRPHPTPERLAELMKVTKPAEVSTRFELKATAFAFEGGSVRVTCYAPLRPELLERTIRYGLEGATMKEVQLSRIENSLLIDKAPCGDWVASCTLANDERREVNVHVKGQCNSDGQ